MTPSISQVMSHLQSVLKILAVELSPTTKLTKGKSFVVGYEDFENAWRNTTLLGVRAKYQTFEMGVVRARAMVYMVS